LIREIRRWARKHAARGRYTPVGVTFHWVMAALVIYQLLAGWQLERLGVGAERMAAYANHAEMGLLILFLAILRGIWRLIVPGPVNDADALGWQSEAAHLTHIIFYLLFALLPLSGWVMWSAITPSEPLTLAGIVPMPPVPLDTLSIEWKLRILEGAERTHGVGIIALALLVPLHIGAALKHHFWDRHDVLEGMLPEIPDSHSHPQGQQHVPPPAAPGAGSRGG
jgi:cytochrome b561